MELNMKIRSKRKELKLTQVELSERSGVPQYVISRLENGQQNITLCNLVKIMNVLKLKIV